MRKALTVGIDYYNCVSPLHGCVNDAHSVSSVLERHADNSINFSVMELTGTGPAHDVTRSKLKEAIKSLFENDCETALFYFAGHGYIEVTGGYLITSECESGDDGLPLNDVLLLANKSPAKNKVIILDSCHSGIAGTSIYDKGYSAELAEGVTILTASTSEQYATEKNGAGVFTSLLVDALKGAGANLVGDVTPGSVYAHIDQSLGPWEQRPVFKTNVKSFVSLRKVESPIALSDLQKLSDLFPTPGFEFQLDPSFEPEMKGRDPGMPPPNPQNNKLFAILQRYNRLNLLIPVNAPHMWNAAMESKSCQLTALGEHYRRLVEKKRI